MEGEVDTYYGYPDPIWNGTGFRGFDAGLNLKSTSGWSGTGNGSDLYGFTGLPGGVCSPPSGVFNSLGDIGYFMSSTQFNSANAWSRVLHYYDHDDIGRINYTKTYGLSVRCFKYTGPPNLPPNQPSNPSPEHGAINQPINIVLNWTCSDPENDPLTYDIYFGTETDPPLLDEGISNSFYDPGILNYGITYYWKIVAEDDHGNTTESPIWDFTTEVDPFICGDVLVDVRDGQSYNTVLIGDQCWMAENMNIGIRIDGTIGQSDNATIEKYCYNDEEDSCVVYSGLYQWNEMMQYTITQGAKGICTIGWHLPTDAEWCTLENEVDAGTVSCTATGYRGIDAGLNLKSTSGWNEEGNGTDLYGFTALPGGYRNTDGNFYDIINRASFWSSSEYLSNAWIRHMYYNNNGVWRNNYPKGVGRSVRCLKN